MNITYHLMGKCFFIHMCECVWDGMVELYYAYPVFNRTHVSSIGLRKWEESMTQTSSP